MIHQISLRSAIVFWVLSIECGYSFMEDEDFSTLFQLPANASYPKSWLERCGVDGNIPVFDNATEKFQQCFHSHLNTSTFAEEFGQALFDKQVSAFMKQHCQKEKPLGDCLNQFSSNIEDCLDPPQKEDLQISIHAVKAAMDFICHRDGERVLLFMKDDGINCFTSQQDALKDCVNNTSAEDFVNSTDMVNVASITYNSRTCGNINTLSSCFFHVLEKCEKRGPSLVFEALSKTVLKATPCWVSSSAHTKITFFHSIFLLTAVIASLLYADKSSRL